MIAIPYIRPLTGRVRLSDYSSLRKLMRAARRGKLPEERLGTIERAQDSAQRRRDVYFNSAKRERMLHAEYHYDQFMAAGLP